MAELLGSTLMAFAAFCGIAVLAFHLWRRGKLARFTFLPKPPEQKP